MIGWAVSGCYLLDSARGQLTIMSKRQPIARLLRNPATPAQLRSRLESVVAIRDFATRRLGLPENGSYRSYADIERPYVVWNVVAAPEFSVDAAQWCYPIVGCVAYRGYFAEAKARKFARRLRRGGFEVSVQGVAAYSTLGYFADPVLNTMVVWSDADLAAIVFHELTHQFLYVRGDASFNEALATTIEAEGVRRWLIDTHREEELRDFEVQQRRYAEVVGLLSRTRAELRTLYASAIEASPMRERKRAMIVAARGAYARLRAAWSGRAPFESWFEGEINNAHLASMATYTDCVPGFERVLAAEGGDLGAFYRRVRELAALSQRDRDAAVCVPPSPAGAALTRTRVKTAGSGAIAAQSRVVLESSQILASGGDHGLWFDAKLCETIPIADVVHRQRAVVIAGIGAARHEIHQHALDFRQRIRQTDYPMPSPHELRNPFDDLAQRKDLWAAQLVKPARIRSAAQTPHQGLDHVIDEYRLEASVRPRQRKDERNHRQKSGETIQEGIPWTENDRRLQNGPIQAAGAFADELFGFTLGAEVVARSGDRGLERRHLQQAGHARGTRSLQKAAREFDMRAAKAVTAKAALVENTHEIDHDLVAAKAFAQLGLVVHIAVLERQPGQHQQVLVLLPIA